MNDWASADLSSDSAAHVWVAGPPLQPFFLLEVEWPTATLGGAPRSTQNNRQHQGCVNGSVCWAWGEQ